MAIQKGSDMLLKIRQEDGAFEVLGGLRARTVSLSSGTIDVTNADSGGWRELLSCGGTRRADVSGSGVFVSDAAAERARALFFAGELSDWQLVLPGTGTLEGPFQVANLDYAGDFRGEATFSLSLASAGEVSFVPAVTP
jgi:TP901-1 family phage major tail protein